MREKNLREQLAELDRDSLDPKVAQIVESLIQIEQLDEEVGDYLPLVLQQTLQWQPIRQRYRTADGRIYTTTYVLFPGIEVTEVEKAFFEEDWDWWRHGKMFRRQKKEDGGYSLVLAPFFRRVPAMVGIDLAPGTPGEFSTPWGDAIPVVTYSARIFENFEGVGRYEFFALDGGSALRSVWDGVAPLGFRKLLPLSAILYVHLWAEAGTAPFPLPKGTGFSGLVEKLTGQVG